MKNKLSTVAIMVLLGTVNLNGVILQNENIYDINEYNFTDSFIENYEFFDNYDIQPLDSYMSKVETIKTYTEEANYNSIVKIDDLKTVIDIKPVVPTTPVLPEEPVTEPLVPTTPIIPEEPVTEPLVPTTPIIPEEPVVPITPVLPEEPVTEPLVPTTPIIPEEPVVPTTPVIPEEPEETGPNYTEGIKSTNLLARDSSQLNYAWSFHGKINSWAAYEQGWTGQGIKVAILDSGINYNHVDLNDNIIGVYSTLTYSPEAIAGFDDNKHGTMVAGIIAAEANDFGVTGVAYDTDIISIKVLNEKGMGNYNDVGNGLQIAIEQEAKVVNISIGGLGYYDNPAITQIYKDAINADVSLIVAAGNQGVKCANNNGTISGCSYPAVLPIYNPEMLNGSGAFIVVGSSDKNGKLASYSNSAGILKDFFMVAPGGNTWTTEFVYTTSNTGGYAPNYGTSFAAPMVTGAFALLAQKFPYLKGKDIANILFASATDLGAVGVDDIFGHGLLNIEKAMQPIGTLTLPVTNSINGPVATLETTSLAVGSGMSMNLNLGSILVLDSYKRGYSTKIEKTVNDVSYDISDFKRIDNIYKTNFILGLDEIKQSILIGYNIYKDEDNSIKILASRESNVFGTEGTGATFIDGDTYYTTLEYKYKNLGMSVTHGYSNPEFGGYFKEMSAIQGIGADINYNFGKFKIGTELPMRVQSGTFKSEVPTIRNANGDIESEYTEGSFKGKTDYKVYFKYELKF